jgi:hypothetical protein
VLNNLPRLWRCLCFQGILSSSLNLEVISGPKYLSVLQFPELEFLTSLIFTRNTRILIMGAAATRLLAENNYVIWMSTEDRVAETSGLGHQVLQGFFWVGGRDLR